MLHTKTIVVPESRQLDVLSRLLERRGASVWRCPLVRINDAPDPKPIIEWLRKFIASPPKLLVLFTGEGLSRLLKTAAKHGLQENFVSALGRTAILSRGPKPARILRQLSLRPEYGAQPATTEGVIEALRLLNIEGCRIGVQLYGSNPNEKLMAYLNTRSVEVEPVSPYVYADDADDGKVRDLILALSDGSVDMIAFTSKTQVERLFRVANRYDFVSPLTRGLQATTVVAVGPVVERYLEERAIVVSLVPDERYFMKPMVQKIVDVVRDKNLA